MSDEGADARSEVTDHAVAPPFVGRIRHRMNPVLERNPPHVLGRLVNRLDSSHWFASLPADARMSVYQFLETESGWLSGDEVGYIFGPPLCAGTPDECPLGDVAQDVAFNYLYEQSAPVQNVINTAFVPGDLNGLPEAMRLMEHNPEAVTTIENRVLDYVQEVDHRMHSYGVILRKYEARALARNHLMKYLLMVSIAFQVPVTDAASVPDGVWAEIENQAYSGYQAILLLVMHYWVLFIETLWYHGSLVFEAFGEQYALSREHVLTYAQTDIEFCYYSYNLRDMFTGFYLCDTKAVAIPILVDFLSFCHCAVVSLLLILAFNVGSKLTVRILGFTISTLVNLGQGMLYVHRLVNQRLSMRRSASLILATEVDAEQRITEQPLYKLVNASMVSLNALEMSMHGSQIRTSSAVNGCVYLATIYEGEVTFIGMGFRYDDYLVTAQHNVFAMKSCPGKYYLIPFRPNANSEICSLDMDRMLELTDQLLSGDITGEAFTSYDVAIIPIASMQWSRLGVKTLEAADAIWKANVSVYGLEKSGKHKLQRSIGQIQKLPDGDMHEVQYNASTLKGWSGSPVLSGNRKVVAIHCGTNGEFNRGLNFAYVRFIIDLHAYDSEESNGIHQDEVLRSFRGRNGRLARRVELLELEERTDREINKFMVSRADNGAVFFSSNVPDEDVDVFPMKTDFDYKDDYSLECSPTPAVQIQSVPLSIEETPGRSSSPRKTEPFSYAIGSPFVVSATNIKLSAPYFRGRPDDAERFVDLVKAQELGYDPEAFGMPRAIDRNSAIVRSKESLSKSLQDSVDVRTNHVVPGDELRCNAQALLLDLLAPLRYTVDAQAVTKEKVMAQLNSSAVGCSKSPGLPYVADGIQSNSALIERFGVEGLAEQVISKYANDTWQQPSVNFLKIEPTKVEKLDEGLDRCVQAVGLDSQLIFRCFFQGLADAAAESYRKSPVACGWSPLKPGDGKWLYDALIRKGTKILEYDGKAFEFRAHTEEAYSDVSDVMVALAIGKPGVTQDQMTEWRAQAKRFLKDVGLSGYLMADGTLVDKTVAFVLASGRYDTFHRNSITNLYWLIIGLFDCGYSADDIKKKFVIKVGGDDTINAVPSNFDSVKFTESLAAYGQVIHKVKLKSIEDGFEFFSWRFDKTHLGEVQWTPTRFTKHLMNFFNTKHEDRPEALVSHMMNWLHSEPHFDYFKDLYLNGCESRLPGYRLADLPSRKDLILHLRGMEAMVTYPGKVEQFVRVAVESQERTVN